MTSTFLSTTLPALASSSVSPILHLTLVLFLTMFCRALQPRDRHRSSTPNPNPRQPPGPSRPPHPHRSSASLSDSNQDENWTVSYLPNDKQSASGLQHVYRRFSSQNPPHKHRPHQTQQRTYTKVPHLVLSLLLCVTLSTGLFLTPSNIFNMEPATETPPQLRADDMAGSPPPTSAFQRDSPVQPSRTLARRQKFRWAHTKRSLTKPSPTWQKRPPSPLMTPSRTTKINLWHTHHQIPSSVTSQHPQHRRDLHPTDEYLHHCMSNSPRNETPIH